MFYFSIVACLLITCCLGNELPSSRMLGGVDDSVENYNYQVSIEYEKVFRCSGALVDPAWIVTVAHCVQGLDKTFLRVRAGSYMRVILGEVHYVTNYIIHDNYDEDTMDNDIALLQVKAYLFNTTAGFNSIPIAENSPADETSVTVTGWGAAQSGVWLSDQLQKMVLPIENAKNCTDIYSTISNTVTDNMICTRSLNAGPCQGDAGDPLVYANELVGLMSWSFGCAEKNYPAVYTAVFKYKDWIQSVITAGVGV